MIMKIKSSVLFGLIVVICAISGFSLLKRLTHEVDEWRPSDLYSSTNVARRSTYSVVSSAPVSYSEALPIVSSGSGSMFRRRAVSSYAPAVSAPASRLSPLRLMVDCTPLLVLSSALSAVAAMSVLCLCLVDRLSRRALLWQMLLV